MCYKHEQFLALHRIIALEQSNIEQDPLLTQTIK